MLALHTSQRLLFFTEKPGVLNLFCSGKSGKGFKSYVNSHLSRGFGQVERVAFYREGDVPFACRGTSDGTRFHLAPERTVVDHLDASNLGEDNTIIMGGRLGNGDKAKARLGKGEAIVAMISTEARKARFLTCFAASEKGLEGQINTNGYVLQHLGMHLFQGRTFGLENGKRINLIVAGEAFSFLLIGVFAFLKEMVIEPTALIQGLIELLDLFLGRIQTILKHFMHAHILAQSRTGVNGKSDIHS